MTKSICSQIYWLQKSNSNYAGRKCMFISKITSISFIQHSSQIYGNTNPVFFPTYGGNLNAAARNTETKTVTHGDARSLSFCEAARNTLSVYPSTLRYLHLVGKITSSLVHTCTNFTTPNSHMNNH